MPYLEGSMGPVQVLASGSSLILAQGSAVYVMSVCLIGGAIPDQGGYLDERGLVCDRLQNTEATGLVPCSDKVSVRKAENSRMHSG